MNTSELIETHGNVVGMIRNRDFEGALAALDKILLKHPEYTPAWQDRAAVLDKLGAHFDAVVNWDKAIALCPNEGGYYCNRGTSFLAMSEFDLAMGDFNKALEYLPDRAEIHSNMGIVHRRRCNQREAAKCLRKAIECNPDYSDAHLGLALCLLEMMEFEEGWKEFEWRWKHESMVPRGLPHPIWKGAQAENPDQVLMLVGEQGNGDVIQFIRYAQFAKEIWGGKVYAEVRHPVARVAASIKGIDKVVILGERVPDEVVTYIPMLSVPPIVGTEKGFIGPYIKPDPALVDYFDKMVAASSPPGFRVGVCWAGMNRQHNALASAIDARRSLTLRELEPLSTAVPNLVWISLQKGPPAQQVKRPPKGMSIGDISDELNDFWDTAALIANLDLVITVDTAVVHIAAAMGKPTWMLSRYDGCWRWHGDVPDSPWYPSLRQYRQKKDGDWSDPLDRMSRALQHAVLNWRKKAA